MQYFPTLLKYFQHIQKHNNNSYRDKVANKDICDFEKTRFEGIVVGYFVENVAFFHFPSYKNDNKKSADRH